MSEGDRMRAEQPFQYAVIRAVPRVDRGECINVGVVVYCQAADFLQARTHLDEERLRVLDAGVDVEAVRAALDAVVAVCAGDPAAGPAASGSRGERFGRLTAPHSTVVQCGPVHSGVTDDPARRLARLLEHLVR